MSRDVCKRVHIIYCTEIHPFYLLYFYSLKGQGHRPGRNSVYGKGPLTHVKGYHPLSMTIYKFIFIFVYHFSRFFQICTSLLQICTSILQICTSLLQNCTSLLKRSTYLFTIDLRQICTKSIFCRYAHDNFYKPSHIIPDVENFDFNIVRYFTFL